MPRSTWGGSAAPIDLGDLGDLGDEGGEGDDFTLTPDKEDEEEDESGSQEIGLDDNIGLG